MRVWQLYLLAMLGLVALFSISTVGAYKDYRQVEALKAAFFAGCAKERFERSAAESPEGQRSCVGMWRDAPLVVAWYPGSETKPTPPGVLVSMLVGSQVQGTWGVELTGAQPRFWGTGPGEGRMRSLITADRLVYSHGLPCLALMPMQLLGPEAAFRGVVEQRWPGIWKGMVLRNMMPRNIAWQKLHESFEKMYQFRTALLLAGDGAAPG